MLENNWKIVLHADGFSLIFTFRKKLLKMNGRFFGGQRIVAGPMEKEFKFKKDSF